MTDEACTDQRSAILPRWRLSSLVLGLALMVVAVCAAGSARAAVQTVSSSDGQYAWGAGSATLSEDSDLSFVAFFSHPAGVQTGGPATGNVDLARPVGWLQLNERGSLIGPNTHEWTSLCNSAQNVSSYDVGGVSQTGGWERSKPAWTGLWFDVNCGGALGYDFFRVRVNGQHPWELWNFVSSDAKNAVTLDYGADYGVSEEQSQQVAWDWTNPYWYFLTRQYLPEFTPVSAPSATLGVKSDAASMYYAVHQEWGGPAGQKDFGQVVAQPLQRQIANITVCGYRDGREVRCYGEGRGDIFPALAGMTQTVQSP